MALCGVTCDNFEKCNETKIQINMSFAEGRGLHGLHAQPPRDPWAGNGLPLDSYMVRERDSRIFICDQG